MRSDYFRTERALRLRLPERTVHYIDDDDPRYRKIREEQREKHDEADGR